MDLNHARLPIPPRGHCGLQSDTATLQRGESYWAWCARSMANVKKLRGLDEGTKRTPKANSVDVTFRAFSFEQKCYSDQRCRCFVGRASGDQFSLDSIAYNGQPHTNPPKLRLFSNFSDSSPCAVFGLGFVVSRDFHGGDRSDRQSSRAFPAAVCRSFRQAGELASGA